MPDETIVIIGCGLVGGSLGAALRRARPQARVVGVDLACHLAAITRAGAADVAVELAEAGPHLVSSRLVILATPVDTILELLPSLAPRLAPGTLLTDVGSAKVAICARAREVVPPGVAFVGGHPLAGSERSGVGAIDPRLFRNRPYVLCPLPDLPERHWLALLDLVRDLGAVPLTLEPSEHDELLAATSHVPQLVALALMALARNADATHGLLSALAGPALREMTRVAGSAWEVWSGILATNRRPVLDALDQLQTVLGELRQALAEDTLEPRWRELAAARRALDERPRPAGRQHALRAVIDHCDTALLAALARRLDAVRAIGALKREVGAAVLDPGREARLIELWRRMASEEEVPVELWEPVLNTILGHSRRTQAGP
ncbi:MAG TPA: prephenate dehydrogenase/arogenate dehydrogenase family protein [Thermoanaerobaculaceae bacterium]|nr:prephenate dehydrogenase/arogenate dehydrogenase family protein [Thermoanaerobaculaceae bacterium]HRS16228.1 prephenate dehydrogenase/arogenate dehydrogenase family protein [Thermoanaerobaculaceae bacterium]